MQVPKTALFRCIGKPLSAVPFQALLGFLTLLQLVIKNTKVNCSLQPAKQLTMGATAAQVSSNWGVTKRVRECVHVCVIVEVDWAGNAAWGRNWTRVMLRSRFGHFFKWRQAVVLSLQCPHILFTMFDGCRVCRCVCVSVSECACPLITLAGSIP